MNYEESLAYLDELNVFGMNFGLARIEKLLYLLGEPQKAYKTIHVTGTNGKGSVTAMLASGLQAAGIRTGMYISPHLSSYTERMVIDGRQVSEAQFADALSVVRPVVMAATAVAQAPVPQAMVIPLPRSHTLVRKVFGAVATANSILHRCGNALSCSKALPRSVSTGVVGTSSAKMTKWGLPIETKVPSVRVPSYCSATSRRGSSISTVTLSTRRLSSVFRWRLSTFMPLAVSRRMLVFVVSPFS